MQGSEHNPFVVRSSSSNSRRKKSRRSPTQIPQEDLGEERDRQLARPLRRAGEPLNIDSSEEETRAQEAQEERPVARRKKPRQTRSYIPSRYSHLHHMGSMLREDELPSPRGRRTKRRMTAESAPLDFLPSNRMRRAINERPPSPNPADPVPLYLPRISVKNKGVLGVERVESKYYIAVDSHGNRTRVPFQKARVMTEIPYEQLPSPSRRMEPMSRELRKKE